MTSKAKTTSVVTTDLRTYTAELFKASIPTNTLYLTFGRTYPWANEADPPQANTSDSTEYEIWKYMIGGKIITGNDIRHCTPRYDWSANTVYTMYDPTNPDLANSNFYVLTSDYNVYKCLSNNNDSPSTVMPTDVSVDSTTFTSDGYIWKYLYTLSNEEILRFLTPGYIPVKDVVAYDGSLQWLVQENANPGAIDAILVTNPGTGYSNLANLVVAITGDGVSATAVPNLNTVTNTIQTIVITSPGTGYTNATVGIEGGGGNEDATARAIIPPPGGHGSSPLYELGGKYLVINTTLQGSEEGNIPADSTFRQISVLINPTFYGNNNLAVVSTFTQTTDVVVTGATNAFQENEYVYQGISLGFSSFSGLVQNWDSGNNVLHLTDVRGTPVSDTILGQLSAATAFLTSTDHPTLEPFTGKVFYTSDFTYITRAEDQYDGFTAIISF